MNHWRLSGPPIREKMDHSKMMNDSNMDHSKMMSVAKINDSKMASSNPCTDILTDIEYLEHMIPHHQVAIDMSDMLIPHTKNPTMLHLCRDIKRKQGYEIWEMNIIKSNISDTIFSNEVGYKEDFKTKMDIHAPILSKAKQGPCNPLFFKPNDHSSMMRGMDITDKSYLEHMIPHHQVAIDMSKRLLLHTNHPYLMDFCRKLIIDQQGEIFHMNSLLQNQYNYSSELLI